MKKMILEGLLQGLLCGLVAMLTSYLWWNHHTLLNPVIPISESLFSGIGVALFTFVISVLGARKQKLNKI